MAARLSIGIGGAAENDSLSGFEMALLLGSGTANVLDASAATMPVTLLGGGGDDVLTGGNQADSIDGQAGNDLLTGGTGNDSLTGGVGDDQLIGGLGADTLDGGTVNGVTITSTLTGTDTPTNIERIVLIGGVGANKLDASLATVSVVLIGGRGNDTLLGGTAADTLSGGNRNDATVVGGDGTDFVSGGPGSDTLENDPLDTKITAPGDSTIADVFTLLPSWIDAL